MCSNKPAWRNLNLQQPSHWPNHRRKTTLMILNRLLAALSTSRFLWISLLIYWKAAFAGPFEKKILMDTFLLSPGVTLFGSLTQTRYTETFLFCSVPSLFLGQPLVVLVQYSLIVSGGATARPRATPVNCVIED